MALKSIYRISLRSLHINWSFTAAVCQAVQFNLKRRRAAGTRLALYRHRDVRVIAHAMPSSHQRIVHLGAADASKPSHLIASNMLRSALRHGLPRLGLPDIVHLFA